MNRAIAEKRGRRGEAMAAWFLRLQGWRIVGERVKTPRGEVDLIARRGKTVAFVEVKMRRRALDLATAIDAYRLRRVAAAAEILLPKYGKGTENMQIDVILVAPWRWPHHLRNVWHG
ncbi:YraN family protein [Sphingorhabdus sp.]|uniref:YraN family protein n=1 Tax=Sphingorhabdus sp. TaxID=1902408 RepID=UPI003593A6C4